MTHSIYVMRKKNPKGSHVFLKRVDESDAVIGSSETVSGSEIHFYRGKTLMRLFADALNDNNQTIGIPPFLKFVQKDRDRYFYDYDFAHIHVGSEAQVDKLWNRLLDAAKEESSKKKPFDLEDNNCLIGLERILFQQGIHMDIKTIMQQKSGAEMPVLRVA